MNTPAIDLGIITNDEAQEIRTLISARMPIMTCGTTGSGKAKVMEWIKEQAGNTYVYPSDTDYGEASLAEAHGVEAAHLGDVLVRGSRKVDNFFAWYVHQAQPLGKGLAFDWQLLPHEDVQESLDEVLAAMGRHMPGHNLTGVALYVADGRLLKTIPFRGTKDTRL